MTTPPRKGIASPWAAQRRREEANGNPLVDARKGAQPVIVRGRRYTLVVTLPIIAKKAEDVMGLAMHAIGEALLKLEEIGVEPLVRELAAQKLRMRERLDGPCVNLAFGPVELWAAASSTDVPAALAMAVDRLVTALTVCNARDPRVGSTLADHYIKMLSVA